MRPSRVEGDSPRPAADVTAAPASDLASAIRATRLWFENNSGWAPPDILSLAEWMADGVCRCPDECLVAPDECCEHGLTSWWLVLTWVRRSGPPERWDPALAIPDPGRLDLRAPGALAAMEAHERAAEQGESGYRDPVTGLFVMTAPYLWARGCCGSGCRHCPFVAGASCG
jgi:hypothetical protein